MTQILEVFTGRIQDWREWHNSDVLFYDITLKSGDRVFAPSAELLYPYKQGLINSREYGEIYYRLLRQRYRKDPEPFEWLIRQRRIALTCYCGHGKFCHRHLLKRPLRKLCEKEGILFIDRGEPQWQSPLVDPENRERRSGR
ncbi:hypothetical protein CPT_Moabite_188 [Serratia phage Moabite]|uniref:DUF488 domain-containing protein n=2 Tax=Moabitevirus moabite TaxID=2846181 RepID=A0A7T3NBG1_9CAUD|nr:hypothetical protein HWC48_gp228 [Serratia phage Moabite]QDB71218.1 hypothetical protein CPT_Moabite_188 [Serratia phage Moabite]QPX76635.1 hypothetical protein [Serratia phage vB_SmaM_Yaphecito]